MKICIVGAGVVGTFVAERLAKGNHEVAVVDVNPVRLEKLSLKPNILTLNCNAENVDCLEKVKDYDLFVVLTDNDETNLAVAGLIRSINPEGRIIVRISHRDFKNFEELLRAKTVDIVEKTAEALERLIDYPFANNVWRLGNVLIFRKKVNFDSVFLNKKLKELKDLREKVPFTVILIKRRGEYIIPKGDTVVKLGDTIYIAVEDKDVEELKKLLKFEKDRVRDVFVFGYSKYSDRFLERLNRRGDVRVKFFHPDYEICDELSKKYKNVFVFQGDPTDEELLRAEGIERADYVFCLGEGEESDIVLAVFANNLGAKRTCVLIKHPQFEKIIETLKVHSYVLPKKIVASYIYSYLREENIAEVTELEEGVDIYKILYEGEEKPVQNLKLKNCDLIIAVERDGKTFIPKGTTLIQKGDYLYCLRKM